MTRFLKGTPKPLIEEHYHIQELIDSQEKRTEDRLAFRNREEMDSERDNLIKDSKAVVLTDFYCVRCEKDFKSVAIRQVETDWSNPRQNVAFYRSKCFEGHWCTRLITDRLWDGYWKRSKLVAIDRGKHHNDLIQPHESGFNLLYGRKNKQ